MNTEDEHGAADAARAVKRLAGVLAIAALMLTLGATALAQDKTGQDKPKPEKPAQEKPGQDKSKEPMSLEVLAIRATRANSNIDPELKSIADELKKQFKFTGFKLEKRIKGSAAIGKSFKTELIGKYKAEIFPLQREVKRVQLRIEITETKDGKDEPKSKTTFTYDAGTFQMVAGPELGGGDVLIVAVSAR